MYQLQFIFMHSPPPNHLRPFSCSSVWDAMSKRKIKDNFKRTDKNKNEILKAEVFLTFCGNFQCWQEKDTSSTMGAEEPTSSFSCRSLHV